MICFLRVSCGSAVLSRRALVLLLCAVLQSAALAGVFNVGVSPSRFELTAKSGSRLGQSLDIHNQDGEPVDVVVRTLDWTFSESGELRLFDELREGSCRPWVLLERPGLKVPARGKATFRFQMDVPADTALTECRFMLAIEGAQPAYQSLVQSGGASLSLPVNGRLAVAVYVTLNGAKPVLVMEQASVMSKIPSVIVTNTGAAHGRLEGALDARDANGLGFELVPDGSPILPGQTRIIALRPRALADGSPVTPVMPVTTRGALDWEGGSFKVEAEFR